MDSQYNYLLHYFINHFEFDFRHYNYYVYILFFLYRVPQSGFWLTMPQVK